MLSLFARRRRVKALEGAVATIMASQVQAALAKIDELTQKVKAEAAEVATLKAEKLQAEANVTALVDEVADLRAQIGTGLDLRVVLDRLDTLGTHIEGIYTPPAEEPADAPAEELLPGFEVIEAPGDDPTGDALEPALVGFEVV